MNGMQSFTNAAWSHGGWVADWYVVSEHWALEPTSTIMQLSVAKFSEFDSPAGVDLQITDYEYLDSNGVSGGESNLEDYQLIAVNGLTDVWWEMSVKNCR